jgi:hypothetical protein
MRFRVLAAVVAATGLAALGCREAPHSVPTEPLQPNVVAGSGTCGKTLPDQIYSDIDQLFAGSDRTQARNQWGKVVKACSLTNLAPAASEQLTYVQLTIDKFYAGRVLSTALPTPKQRLVLNWNHTAAFVGEAAYDTYATEPGTPPWLVDGNGDATALSSAGAVKVCLPSTGAGFCDIVNADLTAGWRVDRRSITEAHLFSIAPLPNCNAVSTQSFDRIPLCFELDVDPPATLNSTYPFTVELCTPENSDHSILGRLNLAHTHNAALQVAPRTANPFNFSCSNALADANQPRARGLWGAVSRLSLRAFRWLRPEAAYAIHGGLSGISCCRSPWGAIDPVTLLATWTNQTVGQRPTSPFTTPDKGSLAIVSTSPSTVLVQSSLGDIASNLLVINQAGGNCTGCGGLSVTATVKGTPEQIGTYTVSWRSVMTSPNVGYAPFIVRDENGLELARLEYRNGGPAQSGPLTYNGNTTTPVGTWRRSVSQQFEITVDLVNKTTSLSINGSPVSGAQGVAFVNPSAVSVKTLSIELVGSDNQTIGWDDLKVLRLPDPVQ